MALLKVKNLTIEYRHQKNWVAAVRGVDLQIKPGETLGIVGESGSGKSTLALSLMGLLPKEESRLSSDEMTYEGENLLHYTEDQWRPLRGSKIAMIFQDPFSSLNPVLTIEYQLQEVTTAQNALDLLTQVQLPDPQRILKSYPHQISGGQRQRVMIAMALARNPHLLIADEPTTALDVTIQDEIIKLLAGLQKKRKMAMIFVTHNMGLVKDVSDQLAVMHDGQIVEQGKTLDVLKSPKHPYTQGLLSCIPKLQAPEQKPHTPSLETGIKIQHLSKTFPIEGNLFLQKKERVRALHKLSVEIQSGQCLGVVGESGSGKTTFAKILAGFLTPDSGEAWLDGHDLLTMKRAQRASLVQMVFQDPFASLNPKLLLGTQLDESLQIHESGHREKRAHDLMERVGLPVDFLKRYPHQLSGGQRQRFAIARALSARPQLLLADEPVSSLDVSVQAQIINLLNDLRRNEKLTMMVISHDLAVIANLCDSVIVMKDSLLIEKGSVQEILTSPRDPYTKRLLTAAPVV